ncbi:chymotrypsinogen B-like isoform X2 [Palaemon carinicauda]
MSFPRFFDSLEDESRDSKHGYTFNLSPDQTVTIQSPNYPNLYPLFTVRRWTFLGTSTSSTISITCTDFRLRSCWYSSLTIWGLNLFKIYCDTQSTFTATSGNNYLSVLFYSGGWTNYGFQCTVTASDTTTTTSTSTSPTPTSTSTSSSTSTSTPTSTSTLTSTSSSTSTSTPTSTSTSTSSSTSTSTSTSTTTTTSTADPRQCLCGRRNPVVRIVGGQETTLHEYPWQVALTTASSNKPYCGGSIISDQWILTAAHCVDGSNAQDVYVVVGEHDWNVTTETSATQKLQASSIIMHPSYDSDTNDNDVALIQLPSALTFPESNTIAPVCLPDADNDYSNVNGTVTGWGRLTEGGSQPHKLYEVVVSTMTNVACADKYSASAITANMICAGSSNKDSCQGDSGGPLMAPGNIAETFMVEIGVVSWGTGCARPEFPGVYARVSNYLSWINTNIAGSLICPRP